jgi:invasion protein IalB
MLNRILSFQTLVAMLAVSPLAPVRADPPAALAQRVEAFRDWRLDCRADPCRLHTSVRGADGSEVLGLAVGAGEGATLTLSTPLPLFLPDGLRLAVGAEPERSVPWRTCGAGGCEAVLPLDPGLLADLRRERAGTATFTLVDGVRVRLPFSLLGVSAAMARMGPPDPSPLPRAAPPSTPAPPAPRPGPRDGARAPAR